MQVIAQIVGTDLQPTILLDTGALSHNYISSAFLTQHQAILQPAVKPANTFVDLADGVTRLHISQAINLTMQFTNPAPIEVEQVQLEFYVIKSLHEVIIGLPSLLGPVFRYFCQVLEQSRCDQLARAANGTYAQARLHATLDEEAFKHTNDVPNDNDGPTHPNSLLCNVVQALGATSRAYPYKLESPFASEPLEAEEDQNLPPLANFAFAQHFAAISRDEAHEEYVKLLSTHVQSDFLEYASTSEGLQRSVKDLLLGLGHGVFVPENWNGIKDVLIHIPFKSEPPARKLKARHINELLFASAKKEIFRMVDIGMYTTSTSEHASAIVVAPKKTDPLIRICGDYTPLNGHIANLRYPIPNVLEELTKIQQFRLFADMDLTNSFHQFRLTEETSNRLSIVCPWGQFRPVFMPEGIGPASSILQKHVREIFRGFEDWSVIIFDNILLLAHDQEDLFKKLHTFLGRCLEHNVVLKMVKSFIGFQQATFFGYLVEYGKYTVASSHTEAVRLIPFPRMRPK